MKKLLIILAVAVVAVACRNEAEIPTHNVTFEIVFLLNDDHAYLTHYRIGIFQRRNFDFDASGRTFWDSQRMVTTSGDTVNAVFSKSYTWHFLTDPVTESPHQITVSDIRQGDFFVAIGVEDRTRVVSIRPALGYRLITINEQTASEIQRFVFGFVENGFVFVEK